jgi:hypothetical protein
VVGKNDKVTAQRFIELARVHSKLTLEHIGKDACPERKQAIRAEIECLRAEREIISLILPSGGCKMSENFEKYEQLVCREDEVSFKLKTYQEMISELLMLVHKRGMRVLNLPTVEEVLTMLHSAETTYRSELLDIRLAKTILSNRIGESE